jgi:hypothetical protein
MSMIKKEKLYGNQATGSQRFNDLTNEVSFLIASLILLRLLAR